MFHNESKVCDDDSFQEFLHDVADDNLDKVSSYLKRHAHRNVNFTDAGGLTALLIAVTLENDDMVSLLLKVPGIDVNAATHRGGDTPLMQAAANGNYEIAEMLTKAPGIILTAKRRRADLELTAAEIAELHHNQKIAELIRYKIKHSPTGVIAEKIRNAIRKGDIATIQNFIAENKDSADFLEVLSSTDKDDNDVIRYSVYHAKDDAITSMLKEAKAARAESIQELKLIKTDEEFATAVAKSFRDAFTAVSNASLDKISHSRAAPLAAIQTSLAGKLKQNIEEHEKHISESNSSGTVERKKVEEKKKTTKSKQSMRLSLFYTSTPDQHKMMTKIPFKGFAKLP